MSETIEVRDPDRVYICDETLRDGLQTAGVSVNTAARVRIAEQLDRIGVDVVVAGFPASGDTPEQEFEAVQAVAVALNTARVAALCRVVPQDVENAWAAVEPAKDRGGSGLHLFVPTSDLQMHEQNKTPDLVRSLTQSEVTRAKSLCGDVEFSPMDATRTEFGFLMEICKIAADSGANVINIPDTTGYMTYRQYGRLIAAVRQGVHAVYPDVIISAHTHGDRETSTAANMEAIGAGARQVEVSVNGLGPRVGNAALAGTVGNINEGGDPIPEGVYTNVDTRQLKATSQLVAALTGKAAPDNLAFTSPTAFVHVEGIHQRDVIGNPRTFESLAADVYGQRAGQIIIGPLSGKAAVRKRLETIGLSSDQESLKVLTVKAKDFAIQQGRDLADTDLESIAAAEMGETLTDRFEFGDTDIESANGTGFATINIRDSWAPTLDPPFGCVIATVEGGGIEAAVLAINEITAFKGKFEAWHPGSATSSDAQATIFVEVSYQGETFDACATDKSVDIATAKAYLSAINLVERTKQRREQEKAALATK